MIVAYPDTVETVGMFKPADDGEYVEGIGVEDVSGDEEEIDVDVDVEEAVSEESEDAGGVEELRGEVTVMVTTVMMVVIPSFAPSLDAVGEEDGAADIGVTRTPEAEVEEAELPYPVAVAVAVGSVAASGIPVLGTAE